MILILGLLALVGASQVSIAGVAAVLLSLAGGVGGTYGWMAKRKDEAASVWRNIAEAYQMQNKTKDEEIVQLKAERLTFQTAFFKELSQELGVVVGRIVAEELRRER